MSVSLDALRLIVDPAERARQTALFLQRGIEALTAAREVRDAAIMVMLDRGDRARDIATESGVSLSHVKLVRRLHKQGAGL
jgi:hypothetical protein